MHVLLLKNTPVGKEGEVVSVRNGYFRNYLFPNKLALSLTEDLRKKQLRKEEHRKKKLEEVLHRAQELKIELEKHTLKFSRKASSKGKLYGSISESDLSKAFLKEFNYEIKPDDLKMEEHIKAVGDHEVTVTFGDKISIKLHVVVEKE